MLQIIIEGSKGTFCYAFDQMGNFGNPKFIGGMGAKKDSLLLKIHSGQSRMETDHHNKSLD
jgi:hypothetical protein